MSLGSLLKPAGRPCTLRATGSGVQTINLLPVEQTGCLSLLVSFNCISSLENIGQFRHLNRLMMEYNNICFIEDLAPLASLRYLTVLSLEGNPVCQLPLWDIHVIKLCPKLTILNGKKVADLYGGKYTRRQLLSFLSLEAKFHQGFLNCKFMLRTLRMKMKSREIQWRTVRKIVRTKMYSDRQLAAKNAHHIRQKGSGCVTIQTYFSFMRQKLMAKHFKVQELLVSLNVRSNFVDEFAALVGRIGASEDFEEFVGQIESATDIYLNETGLEDRPAMSCASRRGMSRSSTRSGRKVAEPEVLSPPPAPPQEEEPWSNEGVPEEDYREEEENVAVEEDVPMFEEEEEVKEPPKRARKPESILESVLREADELNKGFSEEFYNESAKAKGGIQQNQEEESSHEDQGQEALGDGDGHYEDLSDNGYGDKEYSGDDENRRGFENAGEQEEDEYSSPVQRQNENSVEEEYSNGQGEEDYEENVHEQREYSSPVQRGNEYSNDGHEQSEVSSPVQPQNEYSNTVQEQQEFSSQVQQENEYSSPDQARNEDARLVQQENEYSSPAQPQREVLSPVQQENEYSSQAQPRNDISSPVQQEEYSSPAQPREEYFSPPRGGQELSSPVQNENEYSDTTHGRKEPLSPMQDQDQYSSPVQQQSEHSSPVQKQNEYSNDIQQQNEYSSPVHQQEYSSPVHQQEYSSPVQKQNEYSSPVQQQNEYSNDIQQEGYYSNTAQQEQEFSGQAVPEYPSHELAQEEEDFEQELVAGNTQNSYIEEDQKEPIHYSEEEQNESTDAPHQDLPLPSDPHEHSHVHQDYSDPNASQDQFSYDEMHQEPVVESGDAYPNQASIQSASLLVDGEEDTLEHDQSHHSDSSANAGQDNFDEEEAVQEPPNDAEKGQSIGAAKSISVIPVIRTVSDHSLGDEYAVGVYDESTESLDSQNEFLRNERLANDNGSSSISVDINDAPHVPAGGVTHDMEINASTDVEIPDVVDEDAAFYASHGFEESLGVKSDSHEPRDSRLAPPKREVVISVDPAALKHADDGMFDASRGGSMSEDSPREQGYRARFNERDPSGMMSVGSFAGDGAHEHTDDSQEDDKRPRRNVSFDQDVLTDYRSDARFPDEPASSEILTVDGRDQSDGDQSQNPEMTFDELEDDFHFEKVAKERKNEEVVRVWLMSNTNDLATAFSFWKQCYRQAQDRHSLRTVQMSRINARSELHTLNEQMHAKRMLSYRIREQEQAPSHKDKLKELAERHDLIKQIDRQKGIVKSLNERLGQLRKETVSVSTFAPMVSNYSAVLQAQQRSRQRRPPPDDDDITSRYRRLLSGRLGR